MTSRNPVLTMMLVACLALAACSKQTPSPEQAAATPEPTADGSDSELKARQEELARREAAVAEKERELQLAQREAKVADQEQQLGREKKEAEAAATKAASARDASLKVATARKAAASQAASSKAAASSGSSAPPAPVIQSVEVAAGTPITVALSSALSSKTAQPGDSFEATVASNVVVNGRVVVPTGTRISGNVTEVISGSNSIGAVPALGLKFNQLELEDGQIVPISGELMEQGASEKVQDTAKILGGVAAGAILGHQIKTNNRGKVIGGLLGGAVGAIAAKKTGTEVDLAAGSTVTLTTGEPLTMKVRVE
jgi:type IV secretory pathway VirB10-like protein